MNMWEHGAQRDPKSYGSLGPGSDSVPAPELAAKPRGPIVLLMFVIAMLVTVASLGGMEVRAAWDQVSQLLSLSGKPAPASPAILSQHEVAALGASPPQQQAELLLERDINHYQGAAGEISEHLDGWRGHLQLTPRLNSLVTTALNSNDLRVRASGIEVDLAAMGLAKTPESVDRLVQQAESGEQAQRVWALWTLGLLGNRGVEPGRVTEVLVSQLRDSNVAVRQWAVEGLAYVGSDATVVPLMERLHDDPSPIVRERAACSLAQSGMLSQEQRQKVVPWLLDYADDAALDAKTHGWVYQALRDITAQSLPNDSAAWRNWYQSKS